jgi:cysteine-S-conjugate beta-lyase
MSESSPLTALTLEQLRRRHSEKWRVYPEDVLPLWVAEMDTPLAAPIRTALTDAVLLGDTGYAHPNNLPEAYAEFSGRRFGWAPDPGHMLLVPDVMVGIIEILQVVTAPGDGVVINPPVYPPYFIRLPLARRRIVEVPLTADHQLDLDGLERAFAAGARAYLLCNPQNPTGSVFDRDALLAVAELSQQYGVRVIVDEIHAPLTYPGVRHVPFLSLSSDAVSRAFAVVSTSKAWNLAGLKAALLVAGPDAVGEIHEISTELRDSVGLFGVIASEAALRHGEPWLADLLTGLDANRALLGRLLAKHLPEVGYHPPDASYLAWLDCRRLGLGDDPAAAFLNRGRVALYPGHKFGSPGRGFVRLNLGTSPAIVEEAVHRMAASISRDAAGSGTVSR